MPNITPTQLSFVSMHSASLLHMAILPFYLLSVFDITEAESVSALLETFCVLCNRMTLPMCGNLT